MSAFLNRLQYIMRPPVLVKMTNAKKNTHEEKQLSVVRATGARARFPLSPPLNRSEIRHVEELEALDLELYTYALKMDREQSECFTEITQGEKFK